MMEVMKGPGVLQLLTCRRRRQAKGDLHPPSLQVAVLCSIRIMLLTTMRSLLGNIIAFWHRALLFSIGLTAT